MKINEEGSGKLFKLAFVASGKIERCRFNECVNKLVTYEIFISVGKLEVLLDTVKRRSACSGGKRNLIPFLFEVYSNELFSLLLNYFNATVKHRNVKGIAISCVVNENGLSYGFGAVSDSYAVGAVSRNHCLSEFNGFGEGRGGSCLYDKVSAGEVKKLFVILVACLFGRGEYYSFRDVYGYLEGRFVGVAVFSIFNSYA